jgi:hypothetical protein
MMAVTRSGWKGDAGTRPNIFATSVGYKHEFALKHVNELILLGMSVSRGRLTARQNSNEIDAVILEPTMVTQASVITLALYFPKLLGIARELLSGTSVGLNTFDPLAMMTSSQTLKTRGPQY